MKTVDYLISQAHKTVDGIDGITQGAGKKKNTK
jgi:hypothetical protein